jgi:hypothetical protein
MTVSRVRAALCLLLSCSPPCCERESLPPRLRDNRCSTETRLPESDTFNHLVSQVHEPAGAHAVSLRPRCARSPGPRRSHMRTRPSTRRAPGTCRTRTRSPHPRARRARARRRTPARAACHLGLQRMQLHGPRGLCAPEEALVARERARVRLHGLVERGAELRGAQSAHTEGARGGLTRSWPSCWAGGWWRRARQAGRGQSRRESRHGTRASSREEEGERPTAVNRAGFPARSIVSMRITRTRRASACTDICHVFDAALAVRIADDFVTVHRRSENAEESACAQ